MSDFEEVIVGVGVKDKPPQAEKITWRTSHHHVMCARGKCGWRLI